VEAEVIEIRRATTADAPGIAAIIMPTIRAGETYAINRYMSEVDALVYWLAPEKDTFVALDDGVIVGTYFLKANQSGGGSHVANCGYMTSANAVGKGVARAMCQHSLEHARARGFRAMQFNLVVSTNERAVKLWQAMGFKIVGTLPGAFSHPTYGDVDAYVMFQRL